MMNEKSLITVTLTIAGEDHKIHMNADTYKQITIPGRSITISGNTYDIFAVPKLVTT